MPPRAEIAPQRERARLFFALYPDELSRARMTEHAIRLAARSGGRTVGADALHMTLVFVGPVPTGALADVCAAANAAHAAPFTLSLDRIGAWRANGVGWLAPSTVPQAAIDLSESLRGALRTWSIAFDTKRFKPHVTLVRKLNRAARTDLVAPIEWRVRDFSLMRSRLDARGASYERVVSWRLGD